MGHSQSFEANVNDPIPVSVNSWDEPVNVIVKDTAPQAKATSLDPFSPDTISSWKDTVASKRSSDAFDPFWKLDENMDFEIAEKDSFFASAPNEFTQFNAKQMDFDDTALVEDDVDSFSGSRRMQ